MLFTISDLVIYILYGIGLISIIASVHYGLILPAKESRLLGEVL